MPPASPAASPAQVRQSLLDLLGPLVADAGFDLEDITVSQAGRRSLVRVVVDADGGIDLDAVATVSRVVADALDGTVGDGESEPRVDDTNPLTRALAGAYVLEVTSPGVDRPLSEPRHWRRATGRLVTTQVGGKTITGRVRSTDDGGATLEVKGQSQTVAWDDLGRGKVQIEFNRSEKG